MSRDPFGDATQAMLDQIKSDAAQTPAPPASNDQIAAGESHVQWAIANWDSLTDEQRDVADKVAESLTYQSELAELVQEFQEAQDEGYNADTYASLVMHHGDDLDAARASLEYVGKDSNDIGELAGQLSRQAQVLAGNGPASPPAPDLTED